MNPGSVAPSSATSVPDKDDVLLCFLDWFTLQKVLVRSQDTEHLAHVGL